MNASKTYAAILDGDRLRWLGDAPEVTHGRAVEVSVTVPEPAIEEEQGGRSLWEALETLRASNPFREIDDAVAWQREIRRDRPLPGREE